MWTSLALICILASFQMLFESNTFFTMGQIFVEEKDESASPVTPTDFVVPLKYFHRCNMDRSCAKVALDIITGEILLVEDEYFKQKGFKVWNKNGYCPVRFKALGCFRSHHTYNGKRKLEHKISTRMDPQDHNFEKPMILWNDFKFEAFKIVCNCVSKAKSVGYNIAAIENYGECWASDVSPSIFEPSRTADHLCVTIEFETCERSENLCIGKDYTLFAYKVI